MERVPKLVLRKHISYSGIVMKLPPTNCKKMEWKTTRGALKPCKNCVIVVKAQQKNVHKESSRKRATEPNEIWDHDIATIKTPKKSGIKVSKPVLHMTVDEATGMKMSGSYPGKDKRIEPICEQL